MSAGSAYLPSDISFIAYMRARWNLTPKGMGEWMSRGRSEEAIKKKMQQYSEGDWQTLKMTREFKWHLLEDFELFRAKLEGKTDAEIQNIMFPRTWQEILTRWQQLVAHINNRQYNINYGPMMNSVNPIGLQDVTAMNQYGTTGAALQWAIPGGTLAPMNSPPTSDSGRRDPSYNLMEPRYHQGQ